jgi:uncharacterized surface protein with fasciclin (FAS1) repeats
LLCFHSVVRSTNASELVNMTTIAGIASSDPVNMTIAGSIASSDPVNMTIAGIASSYPDTFSTLVSLLQSAGLVDTLSGAGPFTVFAPTNDAFDTVGEEMLKKLANNSDLLFAVLTYHVVPGLIPLKDLSVGGVNTFDGRFATISSLYPPHDQWR